MLIDPTELEQEEQIFKTNLFQNKILFFNSEVNIKIFCKIFPINFIATITQ